MVSLHRREDLVGIVLEKHLSVKAAAETLGYVEYPPLVYLTGSPGRVTAPHYLGFRAL